jgi:hypothetical protein
MNDLDRPLSFVCPRCGPVDHLTMSGRYVGGAVVSVTFFVRLRPDGGIGFETSIDKNSAPGVVAELVRYRQVSWWCERANEAASGRFTKLRCGVCGVNSDLMEVR